MPELSLSRRQLMQTASLGALSLATPGMILGTDANDSSGKAISSKKSCIFVLLCGGPSQLDTWDLKPNAPSEIRGPYKPISTKVPGMQISELRPFQT